MNREQGVSKSAEKTKKSGKIASPKITANIFLCFPPPEPFDFPSEIAGLPM